MFNQQEKHRDSLLRFGIESEIAQSEFLFLHLFY